jgi:DNA-binding SARP family transcriptional activator
VRFGILGPLEVWDGARPVELGGPKQRAVLAVLAVTPNQVVALDTIVDRLWGDEAPARALSSLHAYISNLRRAIEPDRPRRAPATVLVSKAPGYVLSVEPEDLDALRFERLVADGRQRAAVGDPAAAASLLGEALALWRGPALSDFRDEAFALAAITRLDELRAVAVEDRMDAELALGRHEALVPELEVLVADAPLRERGWGQLMVALYRSGRQADALRAYGRARAVLAEELGIDPGPALQRLEHAVLTQSPDLEREVNGERPAARLVEPIPVPVAPAAAADLRLVGRDQPLALVDDLLAGLSAQRGGALLIAGEAGIGKTALALELLHRARAAGFVAGMGHSPEAAAVTPLWAWRQIVVELSTGDDLPPQLAAIVDGGEGAEEPASRSRTIAATIDWLRYRAGVTPLVVLLDDVQWADEASHQLLQVALTELQDAPVLFVLTQRSPAGAPGRALAASLDVLARRPAARRHDLGGLEVEAIASVISSVAGRRAPEDVVQAVHRRTGGNPFFAGELARLLSSEHALDVVDDAAARAIPAGVRDVIARRLAHLPEEGARLVRVASVLGPDFDVAVVEAMTGSDIDVILDQFELATVTGLLVEADAPPGRYRFSHDLVREAVYDATPRSRRARLHQQAADALEQLGGSVHEVARHAVLAVPAAGAEPALVRLEHSARVAVGQLAMELAARNLRTGLDLVATLPPSHGRDLTELRLHDRLAQVLFHVGRDAAEVAEAFRRARALATEDDMPSLVHVLLGMACYFGLWGDFGGSIDAARELIDLGERTGDTAASVGGHYGMCFLLWTGDIDGARRHLEQSLGLAERSGGSYLVGAHAAVPLTTARAVLALTMALLGQEEPAAALARQAIVDSCRNGPAWAACWAGTYGLVTLAVLGDAAAVLELAPEVTSRAPGLDYTDGVIDACTGWARAVKGDPDAGLELLRSGRALARDAGDGQFLAVLAALGSSVLIDAGDAPAARAMLGPARAHAVAVGQRTWLPELDRLAARLSVLEGDTQQAAALLDEAIRLSGDMHVDLFNRRCRDDRTDLRY